MLSGFKTLNSGVPKTSFLHNSWRAAIAVIAVAGLVAISVVATSLQSEEAVLGQNRCAEPPVEPRDVQLWEHDSGILVQWETCPDHRYELRWRPTSRNPENPHNAFNWTTTTGVGSSEEYDILFDADVANLTAAQIEALNRGERLTLTSAQKLDLINGRRYAVQLRSTHFQGNIFDTGSWTDD